MTTLVTRAQWKARSPKSPRNNMVDNPSITVHWEGGGWKWPWDHSTCDDKVRSMQDYHMDVRGWSDIAYNYLGCPHNYLFEGRTYKYQSGANGNESSNRASYAIQAMWGVAAKADVPLGLYEALYYGIEYLVDHGATRKIYGHRDWKSTDCPGSEIYAWVKKGAPDPSPVAQYEDEKVNNGMALSPEALKQISAVFDQQAKNGNSLHELVQMYSAFNAENTRQNKDLGVKATDLVLADDFKSVTDLLTTVQEQLSSQKQTLNAILNKLNMPQS